MNKNATWTEALRLAFFCVLVGACFGCAQPPSAETSEPEILSSLRCCGNGVLKNGKLEIKYTIWNVGDQPVFISQDKHVGISCEWPTMQMGGGFFGVGPYTHAWDLLYPAKTEAFEVNIHDLGWVGGVALNTITGTVIEDGKGLPANEEGKGELTIILDVAGWHRSGRFICTATTLKGELTVGKKAE